MVGTADAASHADGLPGNTGGLLMRLPTGTKLFLALSAALLPLALIGVVAVHQQTRLADAQARARLRIASDESANAVGIELSGDITALRVATGALAANPNDAPGCARALGAFAPQLADGARFVITDKVGRPLCGQSLPRPVLLRTTDQPVRAALVPQGLAIEFDGPGRAVIARAIFPQTLLRRLGSPTSQVTTFSSALIVGDESMPLQQIPGLGPLQRVEAMNTPIGVAGLTLRTSVGSAPISSALLIALLLPVLMWAAAAGIAWFIVDRLLIRPLRMLRTAVAAYRPGEEIDVEAVRRLPAQEIRDLGDTFRAISRTVALHEAGLAEGLVRQTKLTREVHHRVKNNLQVIASLINFHARGAPSVEATTAYQSIQRRVDALAVVHRHHFAELEENRGLNLRTMMNELASSLRATASPGGGLLSITLDVASLFVNQDVAVALAFLVTETVELAMTVDGAAQIRLSVASADDADRATLRIVARALVAGDQLDALLASRYARVLEGLSRQLRSPLHRDPLIGAFEIGFPICGPR